MKVRLFLKRYFAALNQYKWIGLTSFACISAITAGITALRPEPQKNYAEGTLLYKPAIEAAATSNQASAQQNSTPGTDSLVSDKLLNLVSENLKASRQFVEPERLRDQIKLKKDPKQENRFLTQYWDDDAKRAKLVVESFNSAVSTQNLSDKRKAFEASIQLLAKRKKPLEEKLQVAEEKLRNFSRQEKPAIQAAVDGSLVSAITSIQQQQRQLRSQIEGIDAEIVSIQNKLGMTPEQALVASALSADTTIGNLNSKLDAIKSDLEIQRRELQPKHPDIVALEHQQNVYEKQLGQRIGDVVGSGKSTLSDQWYEPTGQAPVGISPQGAGNEPKEIQNVAQFRQVSSLDKARQELANKLVTLQTQRDRLAQEFNILTRSELELRQNYRDGTDLKLDLENRNREFTRYREAFDQTDKQLTAAELEKAAARSDWVSEGSPQIKNGSNWLLSRPFILIAGGILGVFVAGTLVLLLDLLNGKILIPEEVQAILQQRIPFLGILPSLPKHSGTSEETIPVLLETDSVYLQFYESLRTSLHRRSDQPLKVVLLSSTAANEGKSISACNLAIASAKAGKKTLLLEANLRAPSQLQVLGVSLNQNEEFGSLTDYMQIENIQPVSSVKNLFALPSPGPLEEATEVLESNQVQQLLEQARNDFDLIVVDTTALQVSDALLIETLTDGFILMTRLGYTDRRSLKIVIEKLTELKDIKLLGVVVNDVATSTNHAHLLAL
ncbi:MAG: hypothetical protein RBJ76_05050 [Stenomitos frigidus ULC029]